jgi:hypothetical protein
VKSYGKYRRKVSLIVKRYVNYGWKVSWICKKSKLNSEMIWKIQKKIVKWYGKYGREVNWNVK